VRGLSQEKALGALLASPDHAEIGRKEKVGIFEQRKSVTSAQRFGSDTAYDPVKPMKFGTVTTERPFQ
jgi:hypothetical protein